MMCVLARQGITVHAAIMSSIWSCGQLDVCEFFISTVHIQFDTCYVSSTKIRSKSTRQRGMTFSIYSGHKHLNYLHVSLADIELAESCPHSDLAGPCRLSARIVWTWAPGVHLTGQSFWPTVMMLIAWCNLLSGISHSSAVSAAVLCYGACGLYYATELAVQQVEIWSVALLVSWGCFYLPETWHCCYECSRRTGSANILHAMQAAYDKLGV